MKLTPLAIVAGLACLVPFGFAVKSDLIDKKDDSGEDDEYELDDLADLEGDYEERNRRAALELDEELERIKREALEDDEPTGATASDLEQVLGSQRGTPGSLLAGVNLGAPSESFLPDSARERIVAFADEHSIEVEYDFDDVSLNAIEVRATGDEAALRAKIDEMWGAPTELTDDQLVWLSPGDHRAVFTTTGDGIELRFERYVSVDAILRPTDKAKLGVEPFPLIGAKLDKLESALGRRLQNTGYGFKWTEPGIGHGWGPTRIGVSTDPDRPVIVELTVDAQTVDSAEIEAALKARYGTPKIDDNGLWTWKQKGRAVVAEVARGSFSMAITKR